MTSESTQKKLKILLLIFVAWTFIAIIFTAKNSMSAATFGKQFSFMQSFKIQFVSCLGWFFLTLAIIWFAERFLPEGKDIYLKIITLILFGVLIVWLQTTYQAIFLPMTGFGKMRGASTFWEIYRNMFIYNWLLSSTLYLLTLGIILVATFYRKYKKRELLSSKLEASLSRARLQVFQMQLHPHFLFNTHNAITELIHNDPHTAEKMLTNLSDLLRMSLDRIEVEKISLQKELEFVKKYIEIEQVRFQERVRFKLDIAPETLEAVVPNMVLQPLIENAVKHGIAPLKQGGTIQINSYKKGKFLFIKVSDDGVGLSASEKNFVVKGIGLANTKARLLHLYKDEQNFEINPENEKGFAVLLKIPFTVEEEKVEKHLELINPKLVGSN